jgi:hypothetical protein
MRLLAQSTKLLSIPCFLAFLPLLWAGAIAAQEGMRLLGACGFVLAWSLVVCGLLCLSPPEKEEKA